jgi:hypothetical protein
MEFYRNGLKTNLVADVEIYLRDRVEHLVEKITEPAKEKTT